jgi:hypothetical protein
VDRSRSKIKESRYKKPFRNEGLRFLYLFNSDLKLSLRNFKIHILKKYFIIPLLFSLSCFTNIEAQTDSVKQTKKNCENYYAPWHQTINDTCNVSKFGVYYSFGLGYPHDYKYGGLMPLQNVISTYRTVKLNPYYGSGGLTKFADISFAYKSHMLSLTAGNSFAGTYLSNASGYSSNYLGILLGESVRFKHLMVSLSAGIASTNLYIPGMTFYKTHNPIFGYPVADRVTSFPVELKAFYLASNFIGIGIHISENIVPIPKYSPFYAGLSIVLGFWNRRKK